MHIIVCLGNRQTNSSQWKRKPWSPACIKLSWPEAKECYLQTDKRPKRCRNSTTGKRNFSLEGAKCKTYKECQWSAQNRASLKETNRNIKYIC